MSAPAISVVVASYNHAPWLAEAVDSVLAQTIPPQQVIVVDDGSTDASSEIIHGFRAHITPVFKTNAGTASTLNTGFALASGDWIAIQNSDDVWEPSKLERQLELAERYGDLGLLHTGWSCIGADGTPWDRLPPNASLPDYHGPLAADMHAAMLYSMPVVISSAAISRPAWEQFGPFNERYLGLSDWDLCARVSTKFRFGFVDERLTRVRKHAANAGTDASRLPADWVARDWLTLGNAVLPQLAAELCERAQKGEVPRADAALALAALGNVYGWGTQPALARRMYAKSLALYPGRAQTVIRWLTSFLPYAVRTRLR